MTEDACVLDAEQRRLVEETIAKHCEIRGWKLHEVSCRSNHLHVVVTADCHPNQVRAQFKAWCTRRLKGLESRRRAANRPGNSIAPIRENWWAERGSRRFINDEAGLEAAICYVRDGQDQPH